MSQSRVSTRAVRSSDVIGVLAVLTSLLSLYLPLLLE